MKVRVELDVWTMDDEDEVDIERIVRHAYRTDPELRIHDVRFIRVYRELIPLLGDDSQ